MCRRIYTLLEIINIILCIYYLYGKKPQINIRIILLVCADVLIFEFIESYNVNTIVVILLYMLVFVYTLIEFGTNIRECIISNMLYFMILGIIQLLSTMPLLLLGIEMYSDDWLGLYVNVISIFCYFVWETYYLLCLF